MTLVLTAVVLGACSDAPPLPSASTAVQVPPSTSTPTAPKLLAKEGKSWVAIAHSRSAVYELSLEDVRGILTGRVEDWSQLGGSPAALEAFVPADASDLAATLSLAAEHITARVLPDDALVAAVALVPGGFALVRPEALEPGVLPLIVAGHDPLGDPAETSPLRTGGVLPAFDPVLVVSLGELLPVRCANAALEEHGDFGVIFEGVRPLLERADVAIGGLDAPLTDVSPPTPCERTFVLQGSGRAAAAIASAGIDLLFVNGNHMLDCWQPCPPYAALRDTLARLHRLGVTTVGAGENEGEARRPHVVQVGNGTRPVRLAFLAYDEIAPWNWATETTPGTASLRRQLVTEDVRAAKAIADFVIVGMSWGIEYTPHPTSHQRELAAATIQAGASLVVGNHPHVVQAIERRDGALVIYAQGNFIFDQSWSVPTTQAVVLQAGFANGRLIGYRLRPVVTRANPELQRGLYRPELVDPTGEQGRAILGRIWDAEDGLAP